MYVYLTIESDFHNELTIKGVHSHIHQATAFAWALLINDRQKDYSISFYCGANSEKDLSCGQLYHIEQWDMKNNNKICTWHLKPESKLKEIAQNGQTCFKRELGFWMKFIKDKGVVPSILWNDCMMCDDIV